MRPYPRPGFPPEVHAVWDALRRDLAFVRSCWDTFQQLYATAESVAVLNETAPGAFSLIGFMFRREFVMGICRATDPKATGKKENLTLDQLLHVIRAHCADTEFISSLADRKSEIDAIIAPIRERRNRLIGHLDLQTALDTHPVPLPAVDSRTLGDAIRLLGEFIVEVNLYFTGALLVLGPHVTGPARNIIHGLSEWKRLRTREHERELAELREEAGRELGQRTTPTASDPS